MSGLHENLKKTIEFPPYKLTLCEDVTPYYMGEFTVKHEGSDLTVSFEIALTSDFQILIDITGIFHLSKETYIPFEVFEHIYIAACVVKSENNLGDSYE